MAGYVYGRGIEKYAMSSNTTPPEQTPPLRDLPVKELILGEIQPRVHLDTIVIQHYTTLYQEGMTLPPLAVYAIDDQYYRGNSPFHLVAFSPGKPGRARR